MTPNVQVEFLFDQQQSKLAVAGTSTLDIGDMSVSNYHGVLAYNFGASDAQVRPFVFGGLGATHYGSLSFTGAGGQDREIGGETQFSTTWGARPEALSRARASASASRAAGRPPTSSRTPRAGGATPTGAATCCPTPQYSNQFELTGGITLRF